MRFFQWLRGSRGLRFFGLELLGLGLLIGLLIAAFSFGWYRLIPGVGGEADGDVAAEHEPAEEDHAGHDHAGHDHAGHEEHAGHDHAGHDHAGHEEHAGHDHAGREEAEAIELSDQARRSLQLETAVARLGTFVRRLSVPATIVDWPGRTHVNIAAPLTGTVTSLHVSSGETITSGAPLYTLRLTHQDLVQAQSNFLQMLGRSDVEQREVERLREVAESGAIARKSLLERQYELDKLQAGLRAERESLMLHGLSEAQVDQIERTRRLIREVTIYAPVLHDDRSLHDDAVSGPVAPSGAAAESPVQQIDFTAPPELDSHEHREHVEAQFVVAELAARRGQSVAAGETLVVLANYEMLLAEGLAFQQDADTLTTAARNDWPVQAVLEGGDKRPVVLNDLAIAYVAGEVQKNSRALPFYVPLENEIVQQEQRGEERYVVWRFKPGQRLRLRVPIEQTPDVFVLPVDAIAREGLERYVFVENGDHFDRRPVHIVARDQLSVAVANDGSLLPGETIAVSGAHQLQMALKNQAGGGVDPHAGHNH